MKKFYVMKKTVQFCLVEADSKEEALGMRNWVTNEDWDDFDTNADEIWAEEE